MSGWDTRGQCHGVFSVKESSRILMDRPQGTQECDGVGDE